MFSIWLTVEITCSRKASSEIFLLFCAVRRKRRFKLRPNPCSKCWRTDARKLDVSEGLKATCGLFEACLWFVNERERAVPVENPWEYVRSPVVACDEDVGMVTLVLLKPASRPKFCGVTTFSRAKLPVITGSKLSGCGPAPLVLPTKPPAPT